MKVIRKQKNSKKCFVCGIENQFGLKAPFYEMENNTVVTFIEYQELHQSYPGRTHGGLISALLDELAGRAIWIYEDVWGVTTNLNVKYRKAVPYGVKLKAVGEIVKNTKRAFVGVSKLYDMEGNLLAEAEATYFKMPLDKISSDDESLDDVNIFIPDDITELEV